MEDIVIRFFTMKIKSTRIDRENEDNFSTCN